MKSFSFIQLHLAILGKLQRFQVVPVDLPIPNVQVTAVAIGHVPIHAMPLISTATQAPTQHCIILFSDRSKFLVVHQVLECKFAQAIALAPKISVHLGIIVVVFAVQFHLLRLNSNGLFEHP